jgi:hypothetical protein
MPRDIFSVSSAPGFEQLPFEVQVRALSKVDEEFAGLDRKVQRRVILKLIANPQAPSGPEVMSAIGKIAGPPLRGIGNLLLGVGKQALLASIPGFGPQIQATEFAEELPRGFQRAAEEPTALERSAAGLGVLLPGVVDPAREAGGKFGKGEVAGGIGSTLEALVPAAAAVAIPRGVRGLQRLGAAAKARMPTAANIEAGNTQVSNTIMRLAEDVGAKDPFAETLQRQAADEILAAKEITVTKEVGARLGEARAVLEGARQQARTLQARRVGAASEARRIAEEITGVEKIEPIMAAREAANALRGKKAFQDLLEARLYDRVEVEATRASVEIAPKSALSAIETNLKPTRAAKAQFGASTIEGAEATAFNKLQGRIAEPEEIFQSESMSKADFLKLPDNVQTAISRVIGTAAEEVIPYAVLNKAQQGFSRMARSLEASRVPEAASRAHALRLVSNALETDIVAGLKAFPEISRLRSQAKALTTEQHATIDRETLRAIFANPRHRLASEAIVERVLARGKFQFIEDVNRGLIVGQATKRSLRAEFLESGDVGLIQNLSNVLEGSAAARSGLNRAIVDAAIKHGTEPSTAPGVVAPNLNYAKMVQFLEDRPGTRILLGKNNYNTVLGKFRTKAREQLLSSDPAYDSFLQTMDKLRAAGERSLQRKPGVTTATKRAERFVAEDQFVNAISKDAQFADEIAARTTRSPRLRQSIIRSLIERAMERSRMTGALGESGFLDIADFGKNFNDVFPAIRKFGNPRAVVILKDLADTAQKVMIKRQTGTRLFFTTFLRALSLGRSGTVRTGVAAPRTSLTIGPRELARAASNPELAALLRDAARVRTGTPEAVAVEIRLALFLQGAQDRIITQESTQ